MYKITHKADLFLNKLLEYDLMKFVQLLKRKKKKKKDKVDGEQVSEENLRLKIVQMSEGIISFLLLCLDIKFELRTN